MTINAQLNFSTQCTMTLILNEQQCQKFIQLTKGHNILSETIYIGKGTANHSVLKFLGLKSLKRYLIKLVIDSSERDKLIDLVLHQLQIKKAGNGIAYFSPIMFSKCKNCMPVTETNMNLVEEMNMYRKLSIIVNHGLSEDVMEIASDLGIKGGTILHGRGAGKESVEKLFGMDIEPEKEIVMILMKTEVFNELGRLFVKKLEQKMPNEFTFFVEPVIDVIGAI